MKAQKPRVLTKCVANTYTGPNERIVEVSFRGSDKGCLISLRDNGDGNPTISVYRASEGIRVYPGPFVSDHDEKWRKENS